MGTVSKIAKGIKHSGKRNRPQSSDDIIKEIIETEMADHLAPPPACP